MKTKLMLAILSLVYFVNTANAQILIDSTFTYQGQLQDNGQAADGNYDFTFRLYNFAAGGTQIGPTESAANHPVSNGLFTVELNFGDDAFKGEARWLEIEVNGTTLSPRQKVNPTPYSSYSRNTRGVSVNSDATFVGVGRDTAFNSEEVFGIEATAGVNGYGGMNVKTSQLISRPFYGYYAGNVHLGRHFMDGAGGRWRLENSNGDALLSAGTFNGQFQAGPSDFFGFNMVVDPSGDIGLGHKGGTDYRMHINEDGFVGIGRDEPIESNISFFDVQTSAGNNQFGGMTVATDGAGGIPYYGYSAGGSGTEAFTFFNGGVNRWGLRMGGQDWLSVNGSNGRVGISTVTPTALLDVNGSARFRTNVDVDLSLDVGQNLFVQGNGFKPGGGFWATLSDRRLKKNVQDLSGSLDKLLSLRGVTYEYKDPKAINELEGERLGMIAQEVEKVFPDWVEQRKDGYKLLTIRGFEAIAVEAIRELRQEKDQQIEDLQHENDELKQRLELIEAALAELTTK